MSRQETSLRKFLAVAATAGALAAGLGACQKEETAMPPSEQTQQTPAQPDKNPGDTSNIKPPTDQSGGGDMGQKSQ